MKKQIKIISSIIFSLFLWTSNFAQTDNTILGTGAGSSITTADNLVLIGKDAGKSNTEGSRHILIGHSAGYNLTATPGSTIGSQHSSLSNIYIGYLSGYHSTTPRDNIFIGDQSGYQNTTGFDNVFIGPNAGLNNTTGDGNVFIGDKAGSANNTGKDNTFIGKQVGFKNTTGICNTFLGGDVDLGSDSSFVHSEITGRDNTTGSYNTHIGNGAGGDASTGDFNTTLGYAAGANTETGRCNTFVGAFAGGDNNRNNQNNANFNTYLGYKTGLTNREGINNAGFGTFADLTSTNVSHSTFMGTHARVGADGATVIGYLSKGTGQNGVSIGARSSVTATNSIAIGYLANVSTANEVIIGNAAHASIGGYVNWTATSDGRFKTDVKEDVIGLDFINQLRPVTYHFDTEKIMEHKGQTIPTDLKNALADKNQIRYTGFIAQEVDSVAQAVNFDFSGVDKPNTDNENPDSYRDYYGIRYAEFVVPLVKATQELSQKVEALEKANQAQQDLLTQYEAALENALIQIEALKSSKYEVLGNKYKNE